MAKPIPAPIDTVEPIPAPKTTQPVQPKLSRTFASEREKAIDRLKLAVNTALKNRAWRADEADIEKVEHCHFFNSHDRRGAITTQCEYTAGHTHNVECERDAKGDIVLESLKCGPALVQKTIKLPNGATQTRMETIDLGYDATGTRVVDNHTHVIEYVKSQHITIPL